MPVKYFLRYDHDNSTVPTFSLNLTSCSTRIIVGLYCKISFSIYFLASTVIHGLLT